MAELDLKFVGRIQICCVIISFVVRPETIVLGLSPFVHCKVYGVEPTIRALP